MDDKYIDELFNEDMTKEEIIFGYNVEIKKALEEQKYDLVVILQEKLNDYLSLGDDNE